MIVWLSTCSECYEPEDFFQKASHETSLVVKGISCEVFVPGLGTTYKFYVNMSDASSLSNFHSVF